MLWYEHFDFSFRDAEVDVVPCVLNIGQERNCNALRRVHIVAVSLHGLLRLVLDKDNITEEEHHAMDIVRFRKLMGKFKYMNDVEAVLEEKVSTSSSGNNVNAKANSVPVGISGPHPCETDNTRGHVQYLIESQPLTLKRLLTSHWSSCEFLVANTGSYPFYLEDVFYDTEIVVRCCEHTKVHLALQLCCSRFGV